VRTSLQHGQLVAQDEDLDLFGGVGAGARSIQLNSVAKIR
jgi:hypothetical protein